MNHQVPDELISAYFDGEATPAERAQVEQLLESSTELRQLLDDTSKLSALLHSFPREAAPPELAANVQKQIGTKIPPGIPARSAKRHSLRREWMSFAGGMIATVASLMIYVVVSPNQPKGAEEAPREIDSQVRTLRKAPDAPVKYAKVAPGAKNGSTIADSSVTQLHEGVNGPFSAVEQMTPEQMESAPAVSENFNLGSFIDPSAFEPPLPEEYWILLQKGQVVVVLDPDNHVAVMQLTVVDREKSAEGLKLLFHRHALNPVEDRELDGLKVNAKADSQLTKQSGTGSDDLFAMYVRATQPRLAEALSELKKNQPDLYVKMEPQLPVEISNGLVNSSAVANNEPVANTPSLDGTTLADIDQPTVAEEASLAVNSFARQRGQYVLEDNPKSSDDAVAGLESLENSAKEKSQSEPSKKLMSRRSKQELPSDATSRSATTAASADKSGKDKARADAPDASRGDPSQGYKTFHVVLGSQQQQIEQIIGQQPAMARNPAMAPAPSAARNMPANPLTQNGGGQNPQALTNGLNSNAIGNSASFSHPVGSNPIGNSGFSNNAYGSAPNYSGNGRGNYAPRARAPSDNDRLVKLLIILKQESQAEAAKTEGAETQNNPGAPPP